VLVVGIILLAGGAERILALYGPSYARHGAPLLRLLALASLFRAITGLYMAICRVEGRASRILAAQGATFGVLVVLVAVLAPSHGLAGVGLAWLGASAAVAVVTVWHVIAVLRRPSQDATPLAEPGGQAVPAPIVPSTPLAERPGGEPFV